MSGSWSARFPFVPALKSSILEEYWDAMECVESKVTISVKCEIWGFWWFLVFGSILLDFTWQYPISKHDPGFPSLYSQRPKGWSYLTTVEFVSVGEIRHQLAWKKRNKALQILRYLHIQYSAGAGFVPEEYVWIISSSFFYKLQLLRCFHYFSASSKWQWVKKNMYMEHNMLSPDNSQEVTQELPTNCQEASWWLFMMPPFRYIKFAKSDGKMIQNQTPEPSNSKKDKVSWSRRSSNTCDGWDKWRCVF